MTFTSRRRFLAAAGGGLTGALAGCIGGGGGSPDIGSLSSDDRPVRGDEDASVRMVVFSDFSCPHCARFAIQEAPQIVDEYVATGDVAYFHADFPIPVSETWSYPVASAARAVFEEAGHDAFWSFASNIYQQQGRYSYDVIETVADDVAGVGAAARNAAQAEEYRDTAESDREMGRDWGVQATPAVFVGDTHVENTASSIAEEIDAQLAD